MEMFLLILIAVMVLVTMVCSIITNIIEVKEKKAQPLLKKVLGITSIILIIVLVIGLAVGASNLKKVDGNDSVETVTLEEAGFNEVSLDEYLELIKSSEKNVILVARPTCTYCEAFAPILSEASKELNIEVNYIDTDKFTNDDWTTFNNSLSYLSDEQWGTPLTLIVQNGEIVDVNSGYVELETIISFFTNNGFGE